mgnify:CR=1 FL=1
MSIWLTVPVAALLGYLLGSIPVGLWVCRLYGVDIRTVGSGRTGGTNAWRAAGLKAAIPTINGDAVKGAIAVWAVLAGLITVVCLAIYGWPQAHEWANTWLPALLGPALLVGVYMLIARLGQRRIERQLDRLDR